MYATIRKFTKKFFFHSANTVIVSSTQQFKDMRDDVAKTDQYVFSFFMKQHRDVLYNMYKFQDYFLRMHGS